MVQHVDGIHPELELLGFSDPNPFYQVRVETEGRRSLNPFLAEGSDFPGLRIREEDAALSIGDRLPSNESVIR
jgi:hypothetical protein